MGFKVYGKFIKKDSFIYRTDTYMQFGESEDIIGACVLCNPGASSFKDKSEEEKLQRYAGEREYEGEGELKPDATMKQIGEILKNAYDDKLEGKFMIFNTFTIRNSNMSEAKKLLKDSAVDKELLFIDYNRYKDKYSEIPYILVGWGCEDYKNLKNEKNKWLSFIKEKNITYIGIQAKKPPHYYHPLPHIKEKQEEYKRNIYEQYIDLLGLESSF